MSMMKHVKSISIAILISLFMCVLCSCETKLDAEKNASQVIATTNESTTVAILTATSETTESTTAVTTEAQTEPFEQTQLYKTLLSSINTYAAYNPQVEYDSDEATLNVYLEMPEAIRTGLDAENNSEVVALWTKTVESLRNFFRSLSITATSSDYVDDMNVWFVDEINPENQYGDDSVLLKIRNGEVIYNYADNVA